MMVMKGARRCPYCEQHGGGANTCTVAEELDAHSMSGRFATWLGEKLDGLILEQIQ